MLNEIKGSSEAPGYTREAISSSLPKPTRRGILRKLLYGGVAGTLSGAVYTFGIEPIWVQMIEKPMPIPGLPKPFDGFRLVQLSDPHFGSEVPYEYLSRCILEANRLNPDLFVVTGDIVQHGQNQWNEAAATLLSSLRARHGVLAVLGNHDWSAYSLGRGIAWRADRVADALRAKGIVVLRNEAIHIHRDGADLHIVGLDDFGETVSSQKPPFPTYPLPNPVSPWFTSRMPFRNCWIPPPAGLWPAIPTVGRSTCLWTLAVCGTFLIGEPFFRSV